MMPKAMVKIVVRTNKKACEVSTSTGVSVSAGLKYMAMITLK
jgi:hypothetical protein